jgi:aspartyl protease family protein
VKRLIKTLIFLILLISFEVYADHKIKVMALFTDKVMVSIDGSQKLLKKGQTYKGVTLVSSNSESAQLKLHGEVKKFKLGSEISTSYKQADPARELIVWKDDYNMFRVNGSINRTAVPFLIDTGAAAVALNSITAKRIGLDYKNGVPAAAATASGIAKGYKMTLDKVKVGHILVYNVDAIILDGLFPREVLLGQSFLGRLQMVRDGDKMRLRKKF